MGYKKFAISNGVYAFEDHEIKNIIKINNEGNQRSWRWKCFS